MAVKVGVPLYLVISVVFSLLLSSHHFAEADNEIAKTCALTEYPDVCTTILESDSRSLSANITGLSRIGLEMTGTKASATAAVAYKLINNASSYAEWDIRATCFHIYNSSVEKINQEGLKYFDERKYENASEVVISVNGEIHYCGTIGVVELNESNTLLDKFTTDLKTILHQLF